MIINEMEKIEVNKWKLTVKYGNILPKLHWVTKKTLSNRGLVASWVNIRFVILIRMWKRFKSRPSLFFLYLQHQLVETLDHLVWETMEA